MAMKRLFITAAFAIAIVTGVSADNRTDKAWTFDVYVDEKRIGSHSYELIDYGSSQRVVSNAEFKVRILLITAFSYTHTNTEIWNDDCLLRFDAFTRTNGKRLSVSGERTEEGFVIDDGDDREILPQCVMSFAYWKRSFLEEPRLINPQTGDFVDVTVEALPEETLDVRGERIVANPYRIKADKLELTVWYSDSDEWVALESVARGGRLIRYELS